MNAYLNSVKILLAPEVRNNPDGTSRFLALETSAFLVRIRFFNFNICWPL